MRRLEKDRERAKGDRRDERGDGKREAESKLMVWEKMMEVVKSNNSLLSLQD